MESTAASVFESPASMSTKPANTRSYDLSGFVTEVHKHQTIQPEYFTIKNDIIYVKIQPKSSYLSRLQLWADVSLVDAAGVTQAFAADGNQNPYLIGKPYDSIRQLVMRCDGEQLYHIRECNLHFSRVLQKHMDSTYALDFYHQVSVPTDAGVANLFTSTAANQSLLKDTVYQKIAGERKLSFKTAYPDSAPTGSIQTKGKVCIFDTAWIEGYQALPLVMCRQGIELELSLRNDQNKFTDALASFGVDTFSGFGLKFGNVQQVEYHAVCDAEHEKKLWDMNKSVGMTTAWTKISIDSRDVLPEQFAWDVSLQDQVLEKTYLYFNDYNAPGDDNRLTMGDNDARHRENSEFARVVPTISQL